MKNDRMGVIYNKFMYTLNLKYSFLTNLFSNF